MGSCMNEWVHYYYRDECKSGFTTIIGMNVRVGSLLL